VVGGADHRDGAEPAGFDDVARRRLPGAADPLAAHLEDPFVPVGGGDDFDPFVDGEGHRLLDVDVLAGREGVERHLPVPVVRRGDEHGVDVLVVEQAAVVGDDGCLAAGPGPAALGPAAVGVAQRHHLGVGAGGGEGIDQLLGARTHAGAADSQPIAGRAGRPGALCRSVQAGGRSCRHRAGEEGPSVHGRDSTPGPGSPAMCVGDGGDVSFSDG
jgi:hypothetical protein